MSSQIQKNESALCFATLNEKRSCVVVLMIALVGRFRNAEECADRGFAE